MKVVELLILSLFSLGTVVGGQSQDCDVYIIEENEYCVAPGASSHFNTTCEQEVTQTGVAMCINTGRRAPGYWEQWESFIGLVEDWNTPFTIEVSNTIEVGVGELYFHQLESDIYGEVVHLPPSSGTFVFSGQPSSDPNIIDWMITESNLNIPAFQLGIASSGINSVGPHFSLKSFGTLDLTTGELLGFWSKRIENDIYNTTCGIGVYADLSGHYNSESGILNIDLKGYWRLPLNPAEMIWGCMNQEALNYNPLANWEDISCEIGGDVCPVDFSGDFVVNTVDLLMLLSVFDTACY